MSDGNNKQSVQSEQTLVASPPCYGTIRSNHSSRPTTLPQIPTLTRPLTVRNPSDSHLSSGGNFTGVLISYRTEKQSVVALSRVPDFRADPCTSPGQPIPQHRATIHLNCENCDLVDRAYSDAKRGALPSRPMIEMVIPSSLDHTLAPPGAHVCLLFTQFTPYTLAGGRVWDTMVKEEYARKVFDCVEEYAPGFKDSIVGYEVLPPPDLEQIFGLTGGNIFHGAMSLDQLGLCRPRGWDASPLTGVAGLLLCGAGAHPGGGVSGAAGRLAALEAVRILAR